MSERKEAWMRIIVGIVSGIILDIWKIFIIVLAVVNWIYAVIAGKRLKELAEMSEVWNTQLYAYVRYMTFVTNERPFPFADLTKSMSKFKK